MHHHHSDGPQDAAFWDQMWSRRPTRRIEPHLHLVDTVADLAAGAALDVGCGEGTDALWLATRGWKVTAVDVSDVALDRARAADPERKVAWLQADLTTWQPPVDTYDLVYAQFLHVPPVDRASFFDRLAHAVRIGGTLLFASHAPPTSQTTVERPALTDLYFTAQEVAGSLTHGRWTILTAADVPRVAKTPDGASATDLDTVVRARRTA